MVYIQNWFHIVRQQLNRLGCVYSQFWNISNFVLNVRACEKHWPDSPGKWNTNSKGSSSCTGCLLPPQWPIHRPVQRCSKTFGCLKSDTLSDSLQLQLSPAYPSAADLKSLLPDGCSSHSNCQRSNILASAFHYYRSGQEKVFGLSAANHWGKMACEDKSCSSSCSPISCHAAPMDSTLLRAWKRPHGISCSPASCVGTRTAAEEEKQESTWFNSWEALSISE